MSGYLDGVWKYLSSASPSFFQTDLANLINKLTDANSKQEEQLILQEEMKSLRAQLPTINKSDYGKVKEVLLRLMYMEMMGHRVPFGYIFAINVTQSSNVQLKRLGYLATTLMLHNQHEFLLLLVSSLVRDLQSSSWLDVWCACCSLCNLINDDMIVPIIPHIINCLQHQSPLIRSKSIQVLTKMYSVNSNYCLPFINTIQFNSLLCDSNYSIVHSTTAFLLSILSNNNTITNSDNLFQSLQQLLSTLVMLLKQLLDETISLRNNEINYSNNNLVYQYHGVIMPWCQLQLIKIIQILIGKNKELSEQYYTILIDLIEFYSKLEQTTITTIEMSLLYSLFDCSCSIYPINNLLKLTSQKVIILLKHNKSNHSYMALKIMIKLMAINIDYISNYKQQILQLLLNSTDDSIQFLIVPLLFQISNVNNITQIIPKLIHVLIHSIHSNLKSTLVNNSFLIVDRHSTSITYYLNIINQLILITNNNLSLSYLYQISNSLSSASISTSSSYLLDFSLSYLSSTISTSTSDIQIYLLLLLTLLNLIDNKSFNFTSHNIVQLKEFLTYFNSYYLKYNSMLPTNKNINIIPTLLSSFQLHQKLNNYKITDNKNQENHNNNSNVIEKMKISKNITVSEYSRINDKINQYNIIDNNNNNNGKINLIDENMRILDNYVLNKKPTLIKVLDDNNKTNNNNNNKNSNIKQIKEEKELKLVIFTVEQFIEKWNQMKDSEWKITIKNEKITRKTISDKCNAYLIQNIEQQTIYSTKFKDKLILIHCDFSSNFPTMTIRSEVKNGVIEIINQSLAD